MNKLWEILVPVYMDSARDFTTTTWQDKFGNVQIFTINMDHHYAFDSFVRKISTGVTILRSAQGQWVNEGEVVRERMIPVRFMCNRIEAQKIARFALEHYDQEAIMCYVISSDVMMIEKGVNDEQVDNRLHTYLED